VYNWGYLFNPTVGTYGTLFVYLTNTSTMAVASTSLALTAYLTFDAFGIVAPGYPDSEVTGDTALDYIDNVNYTIPPPLLRFTTEQIVGTNLQVTFLTPLPGVNHVIQQTPSLSPATWTSVSGVTFTTSDYTMTATFPLPAKTEIYRIILP